MNLVEVEWGGEAAAYRILPEQFAVYWDDVARELDCVPHIWQDHWTKEAIYEGVVGEFLQAWGFGTGDEIRVFVITQVTIYPAGRILQVLLAFGNGLDGVLPLIEATLERFAIETKCGRCEVIGRKGWSRKLSGRFKCDRVIMSCDVEMRRVQ